jgi:quinol monooxygenase YgiN
MYGTVAKVRVKPGALEALNRLLEYRDGAPPGGVAIYTYQMDADPNELYMVAVFESKEVYHANAQSAEQNQLYEQMVQWFDGEPEWNDGEIVFYKAF